MTTETPKNLGTVLPAAGVETDLYAPVGPVLYAVGISLHVTNQSATPTTFRWALVPGGGTTLTKHYRVYDAQLGANEFAVFTTPIPVQAGDKIRVTSASGTVSFNLDGSEVGP